MKLPIPNSKTLNSDFHYLSNMRESDLQVMQSPIYYPTKSAN